ncbi:hypothetical protein, partial [Pararcticibacter amylolyticus]|uniref:hypothetical protein n=1 Tax=Pararcticibacter amylolyticus TaxID=2173175 RepID=UPI001EE4AB77
GSCAVMKKVQRERSDSIVASTGRVSKSLLNSSVLKEGRLLFVEDSSDHRYVTEIIPIGEFHYSPADGFRGTASHVTLSGRVKSTSVKRDSANVLQVLSTLLRTDSSGNRKVQVLESTAAKEVKRPGTGYYWWLLLAGGILVWKFRRNR